MSEGFTLMLIGMGTVFLFLILLVLIMNLMGAFFRKYADKFAEPAKPPPSSASDEAEIALVIAAAKSFQP